MKKRGLLTGIAVVVVIAALVASMIGPSRGSPEKIETFGIAASADAFSAYFVLIDSEGEDTSVGGEVGLRISDDFSATLYEVSFAVSDRDFTRYETPTGGTVLGYIWNIEYTEVEESDNRNDSLNADLSFKYKGNTLSKSLDNVPFPPELRGPNKPPEADLKGPTAGWSERPVHFDASNSTDPNMNAMSFAWTFGDGQSQVSGDSATHSYARAGRFTVELMINDSEGGSSSVSHNITITNPETITIIDFGIWKGGPGPAHSGDFYANVSIFDAAPFDIQVDSALFQVEFQEGQEIWSNGTNGTNPVVINPGDSIRMRIYFTVPPSSTPMLLTYDDRLTLPFTAGPTGNLTVHFFDVGQGDAVLIEDPGSKRMLIDCGPDDAAGGLLDDLRSLSVTTIDVLIATHPDSDHIGGADEVLAAFDVLSVYHPGYVKDTSTYRTLLSSASAEGCPIYTDGQVDPGDLIPFGGTVTRVLSIDADAPDSNSASIVLRVTFGSVAFLFTGDIDFDIEDQMMSNHTLELDADFLKVSHHGSKYASSDAFLDATTPAIGIISVGAGNTYGHPSQETVTRLADHGVNVYRTDLDGTVVVSTDGESWDIDPGSPSSLTSPAPNIGSEEGGKDVTVFSTAHYPSFCEETASRSIDSDYISLGEYFSIIGYSVGDTKSAFLRRGYE
ncbi:MAG: PKD domain-containing protein [Methanomassiliicoccales archaeon]|nr:PKD domain-containing protein [Methanomassiliicoccales archaeon]